MYWSTLPGFFIWYSNICWGYGVEIENERQTGRVWVSLCFVLGAILPAAGRSELRRLPRLWCCTLLSCFCWGFTLYRDNNWPEAKAGAAGITQQVKIKRERKGSNKKGGSCLNTANTDSRQWQIRLFLFVCLFLLRRLKLKCLKASRAPPS